MTSSFRFLVGSQITGLPSAPKVSRQLVALTRNELSGHADGLFAIIESHPVAGRIYDAVVAAFQGTAPRVAEGDEERFLISLLAQWATAFDHDDQPGAAVAVVRDHELIVAYFGGCRAYACRAGTILSSVAGPHDSNAGGVQAHRFRLQNEDSLVLASSQMARFVPERELRETLRATGAEFLPQSVATWLVTLAVARSGSQAAASVIHCLESNAGRGESWLRRAALATLVAAIVAVAVIALARTLVQQHPQVASASEVPNGLRTVRSSPTEALLAWSPVSGASGYIVRVGNQTSTTATSQALVSNALQPGKRYQWAVQARFPDHVGPASPPVWLQVPTRPDLPAVVPLRPGATDRPAGAGTLFCWRATQAGQRFRLLIEGPVHLTRSLASADTLGTSPTYCLVQALPAGHTYHWRVVEEAAGYRSIATPWRPVYVAAPHRKTVRRSGTRLRRRARPGTVRPHPVPTRTPLPAPPPPPAAAPPVAPAPVVVPTPRPVYRPPVSQPVYGPPAPPVNPPAPAPAPTAAIKACPNPPNCT